ncbi:MAG: hypothetical protein ABJD11_05710 [Gemmatimonadota bacterium]
MNEKQLAALIKKNSAKAASPKSKERPTYDSTLEATRRPEAPNQADTEEMFKEMKKREF